MLLFKTVEDLQNHIAQQKQNGQTIGFIPTMGALHQGHISLMKQSISQNDNTVCSIFVNPTQFNVTEDLVKYPRTIEKDIEMLAPNLKDQTKLLALLGLCLSQHYLILFQ